MLIKPRALEPGDTLGIVAPASPPPDANAIDRGVAALEKLGFKVKLAPNVRKRRGFLAGTDRERAGDLMRMFTNRKVHAILCLRGGHGTTRLLPLLDYKLIHANAKIFVGYSDITALHCAFLVKAKMISFHGPMVNADFAKDEIEEFTWQHFLHMLSNSGAQNLGAPSSRRRVVARHERAGKMPALRGICDGYSGSTVKILRAGTARGSLIGGNLSLLCALIGTPWQPPFRNSILFLEETGEAPYRIDRMLTHLLNCGLLQQVAGIAIGINTACEDKNPNTKKEFRQTADDVLKERLLPLKIPIVTGLPFGHTPHNATLPIGAEAILDAKKGDLLFPGPAVR
jgi:muramoyltetrapeptide carboxypeptidase